MWRNKIERVHGNLKETREVTKLPNSRPIYRYYELLQSKTRIEVLSKNNKKPHKTWNAEDQS